jgi:RecA/RadA recombinase
MSRPVNISAIVKSIKPNKRNFTVITAVSQKTYECYCWQQLPIKVGDIITGSGTLTNKGYSESITFDGTPVIEINTSEEEVIACMIKVLKGSQFGNVKAQKLCSIFRSFDPHSNLHTIISNVAQNFMQEKETKYVDIIKAAIPKIDIERLLKWWNKYRSLRRLYLLGLDDKEIKKIHLPFEEIYIRIMNNIYTLIELSLKRCDEILANMKRTLDPSLRRPAEIARCLLDHVNVRYWTCTPIEEAIQAFPDIHAQLDSLHRDYGVILDRNCLWLPYQYAVETGLTRWVTNGLKKNAEIKKEIDRLKAKRDLESIENNESIDANQVTWSQGIEINLDEEPGEKTITVETKDSTEVKKILQNISKKEQKSGDDIKYSNIHVRLVDQMVVPSSASAEQKSAVYSALANHLSNITGGAGTGKTTITNHIVQNLKKAGVDVILVSFTGKAVVRIQQVVGRDNAYTIHRTLCNSDMPKFTYVLVDESSMVTAGLWFRFAMRFCKNDFSTVFIGDKNQLQPIGWGCLFEALLDCGKIPTVVLTKCYRSDAGGNIIRNAQSVIDGTLKLTQGEDFKMIQGDVGTVIRECEQSKSEGKQVTVLCPFNKELDPLNKACQNIFNKPNIEQGLVDERGTIWTTNDRVIMTENDYDINVMNGEEGLVTRVEFPETKEARVWVRFNGEEYPFYLISRGLNYNDMVEDEFEEKTVIRKNVFQLAHSWGLTVHKSQGSEWPHVIYYIPDCYCRDFINKKLQYTAMTRPSQSFRVIGCMRTFITGLSTLPAKRQEKLLERLSEIVIIDMDEEERQIGEEEKMVNALQLYDADIKARIGDMLKQHQEPVQMSIPTMVQLPPLKYEKYQNQ